MEKFGSCPKQWSEISGESIPINGRLDSKLRTSYKLSQVVWSRSENAESTDESWDCSGRSPCTTPIQYHRKKIGLGQSHLYVGLVIFEFSHFWQHALLMRWMTSSLALQLPEALRLLPLMQVATFRRLAQIEPTLHSFFYESSVFCPASLTGWVRKQISSA